MSTGRQELHDLTESQSRVLSRVDRIIARAPVAISGPAIIRFNEQKRELTIGLKERDGNASVIELEVTAEGRCEITAPGLHDGFYASFAETPDLSSDDLGDIDEALVLLDELVDNRVESQLVFNGDTLISTEDYVVRDDGTRDLIVKHTLVPAWIGAIWRKKTIVVKRLVGGPTEAAARAG